VKVKNEEVLVGVVVEVAVEAVAEVVEEEENVVAIVKKINGFL
jgi:hypothetical protein